MLTGVGGLCTEDCPLLAAWSRLRLTLLAALRRRLITLLSASVGGRCTALRGLLTTAGTEFDDELAETDDPLLA